MTRLTAIIYFLLGCIFTAVLFFLLSEKDKTLINAISLIGFFFTIYGLVLGYLQISSVRQIAVNTQSAVETSTLRTQQVLTVADLSKSKGLTEEIQYYLMNNDLSAALIRMKDLKEGLIENRYISQLAKGTNQQKYRNTISNAGIAINSLNEELHTTPGTLDKMNLIKDLNKTKEVLSELEHELKYKL